MKRYLRSKVWFPNMDKLVENFVQSCHACLAATPQQKHQPLITTKLPEGPWRHIASDFKGPIAKDYYFLLLIDEYTRFPEVAVLDSTAADTVVPHFDRILATHGIPEKVKTDNGPPFNSHDFTNYAKKRGFKHQPITPEQPSSNGLAENFMKMPHRLCRTQGPKRSGSQISSFVPGDSPFSHWKVTSGDVVQSTNCNLCSNDEKEGTRSIRSRERYKLQGRHGQIP